MTRIVSNLPDRWPLNPQQSSQESQYQRRRAGNNPKVQPDIRQLAQVRRRIREGKHTYEDKILPPPHGIRSVIFTHTIVHVNAIPQRCLTYNPRRAALIISNIAEDGGGAAIQIYFTFGPPPNGSIGPLAASIGIPVQPQQPFNGQVSGAVADPNFKMLDGLVSPQEVWIFTGPAAQLALITEGVLAP
jgi:hypothetical protein